MDADKQAKIPLLEDVETAVPMDDSIYPVKNQNKHKKCCKKRRCLKKIIKVIFKIAAVLLFLALIIGSIAGYKWYSLAKYHVQKWTVTEPNPNIPIVDVPTEDVDIFKFTAKAFFDSIQAGKVPEDFVAQATDLNGLVASSDCLRGNMFAVVKTNKVMIDMSMPADHLPGGKGRFLVGTETITWNPETSIIEIVMEPSDESMGTMLYVELSLTKMEEDENTLNLKLVSGKFLDWVVPQEIIDEEENLLEDLYNCDCHDDGCKKARKFLEGLAGVELNDDEIVVHANPEPKASEYYKNMHGHHGHHGHHRGHHHGLFGHHHGKHGHGKHHGKHGHGHGGEHRGHRGLREKVATHHHSFKAAKLVHRLLA